MNEAAAKPVVQFIARLQEDGGLKGTDIANFTGVSKGHRLALEQRPEVAASENPVDHV